MKFVLIITLLSRDHISALINPLIQFVNLLRLLRPVFERVFSRSVQPALEMEKPLKKLANGASETSGLNSNQ